MTEIGTDYGTKESYWRTKQGSPGSGEAAFKPAEWLARKTSEVMADQFARWKVSPNDQQQMQRFRLTNQWPVTDQYKAQTHSGVWATAPYLHNGSVPNLYLLLGTKEERDEQARTFCVGHDLTYDPVNVGFVLTQKCDDMYKFDTSRPNNSNKGHEFKDAPDCDKREGDFAKNGVLGCALSHDERMALIEYLKTIPETEPVGR